MSILFPLSVCGVMKKYRSNKASRALWKHLLTTTVVALSIAPACSAQRGRIVESLFERYDTNGDGKLSESERAKLPERLQGRADSGVRPVVEQPVPDKLKKLYKVGLGPHKFESISTLTLEAKHREDDLPFRVTYPKSTGKFPVIVFCHGAFGSKDAYDPLVHHWASHGYVIIQPTHGDSLSLREPKERMRIATARNPFQEMKIQEYWQTRGHDANLVINSIDSIARMHAPLKGKLNMDRIAVGGHSYGAQTTQLLGGLNLGKNFKHDSVRALLLLSPPGPNRFLVNRAYRNVTLPVMTITGSKDNTAMRNQQYTDRIRTHETIPSQEKYLVFMENAEHNLGGVSGTLGRLSGGEYNAIHLLSVKSATMAFWDLQLKSDSNAKSYLTSDDLKTATNSVSKITVAPQKG